MDDGDDGDGVQARKRRLLEMKEKAQKKTGGEEGGAAGDVEQEGGGSKQLRFRNYQPYDQSLAAVSVEHDPTAGGAVDKAPATEEKKDIIQQELQAMKTDEVNPILVPKKLNHDLHSMVEGRLERLKRRTQRAIVEILREKLSQEQE